MHDQDERTPTAWEVHTYDGGVGIEIDGTLHMGYDLEDLKKAWAEYLDRKVEKRLDPVLEVDTEPEGR